MRYITLIVLVLPLAACGSSGPSTVVVHGSFDIDFASSNPDCVSGGNQVTITDASGKVIATATLPATPVTKKITPDFGHFLVLILVAGR